MGLFSPPILIHTIVNILTTDYRQSSCTNDVSNKIIVSINYISVVISSTSTSSETEGPTPSAPAESYRNTSLTGLR